MGAYHLLPFHLLLHALWDDVGPLSGRTGELGVWAVEVGTVDCDLADAAGLRELVSVMGERGC